jgi:tetratricopeptide (TPR) repeat protein
MISTSSPFDSLKTGKIQERLAKARSFMATTEFDKAIFEYNRILFLAPESHEFYYERAQCYLKLCDLSSAIANVRKAFKLSKLPFYEESLSQLCFMKGLGLIEAGFVESALELISPTTTGEQTYVLKAVGYLSIGEKQMALKTLTECIEAYPATAIEALVLKGKVLWSIDREAEGNMYFWKAFNIDQSHPDVTKFVGVMKPKAMEWGAKAKKAIFDKDFKKAVYCINKGLEFYEESSQLYLLRASLHRIQSNFEQALNDLERASKYMKYEGTTDEVNHQIALTYNNMGQNLFKQQMYSDAITIFNEAINFMAQDAGLFLNRGDCYREMGKLETALADYHHALELNAEPVQANLRLSMCHYAYGVDLFGRRDFGGAHVEFSRAVFYNEYCADFYTWRAKTLIEMSKIPEAYADLKRAIELDEHHQEAHRLLSNFKAQKMPSRIPEKIVKLLRTAKLGRK